MIPFTSVAYAHYSLSLQKRIIMKTIYIISFASLFIFASCGGKKSSDSQKENNDTTSKVKLDDALKDTQLNTTKEEVIIVDSSDVITNTEILNEKGQLDPNSSPTAVVQTMIKAAKTKNYGGLIKLCNEAIEMDGDAKDVCGMGGASKDDQKDFNEYFSNAKIVGKPRIDKGVAEVDIQTT